MATQLNDGNIENKLKEVNEKIISLNSELKNFVPITNMSLKLFGESFNLHVTDLDGLKHLYSYLRGLDKMYTFKIAGFTVDEWVSDIQHKIHQHTIKTKLAGLQIIKTKLESLFSADKQKENDFNNLLTQLDSL